MLLDNRYVIIMAGGVGSRFWPLSRSERPKQFLDILGNGETLLQQTFRRFSSVCRKENIYIVTSSEHKDLVTEQLKINSANILAEPFRRNTAPCLAYGTFRILKENPEAVITVTPADHLIIKEDKFSEVIKKSFEFAEKNSALLTLGIKPDRPETGYGYIQADRKKTVTGFNNLMKVKTFTEKPDIELAKVFLESGDFYWNSGIFIWNIKSILNAFEKHLPEMYSAFEEGRELFGTRQETKFIGKTYAVCRSISIDYGIMEKASKVAVIEGRFLWDDLGSWTSLERLYQKDRQGNICRGDVCPLETRDSILVSEQGIVATVGVSGLVVIDIDPVW